MGSCLFANNAVSTLAASINDVATSATLATGTGARFPSPTGSDFFMLTFTDAATGLTNEIVKVTSRSGDVVTIVRAQEGTAAQAWAAGDGANGLITAGALGLFFQGSAGLFEDGTVGAPGAAFINDLDTGLYRPATNTLGLTAGGVEFMRSTSSLTTFAQNVKQKSHYNATGQVAAPNNTWVTLFDLNQAPYQVQGIIDVIAGFGTDQGGYCRALSTGGFYMLIADQASVGSVGITFQVVSNTILQAKQNGGGSQNIAWGMDCILWPGLV